MELSFIKKNWKNNLNFDVDAGIEAWNSVAEDYVYDGSVTLEKNTFLKFMQSRIKLAEDMSVLDIGCGAGAYSLALAAKVHKVVGVDFSPKMIETAKKSANLVGIKNADFLVRDWHLCDGSEFFKKYDIVFAHTTPAIADFTTFMKMINSSGKYCFLCKPARRTDDVFDKLRVLLNMENLNGDESISYAFDTIWGLGYEPEIKYEKTVWHSEKTLNEAEEWYLGRLKNAYPVSKAQEDEIKKYLNKICKDGKIEETTHTTLVTLFWEVSK